MTTANRNALTPARIMEVGMAFWPSKVLLSAIKLGLFTQLGKDARTGAELRDALNLHPRSDPDFFDTLVALRFLERDGDGEGATYRNTAETGLFLDRNSPAFMGGFLEMANDRLYPFWGNLVDGLKTGKAQNETKDGGKGVFEELYSQPERLEQFMDAMAGISFGNFQAFAEKFDFSKYKTMTDVGGATGLMSMLVAKQGSSRGDRDRSTQDRRSRIVGSCESGTDRLFCGPDPAGRCRDDGNDPSRLESREQNDVDPQSVRRTSGRRRIRSRRESDR